MLSTGPVAGDSIQSSLRQSTNQNPLIGSELGSKAAEMYSRMESKAGTGSSLQSHKLLAKLVCPVCMCTWPAGSISNSELNAHLDACLMRWMMMSCVVESFQAVDSTVVVWWHDDWEWNFLEGGLECFIHFHLFRTYSIEVLQPVVRFTVCMIIAACKSRIVTFVAVQMQKRKLPINAGKCGCLVMSAVVFDWARQLTVPVTITKRSWLCTTASDCPHDCCCCGLWTRSWMM